jgi:hypothetical protein
MGTAGLLPSDIFLISLFNGLLFSLKKSLVSFAKFILRYNIVFEAIVNGVVSLISFLGSVLLVYRKASNFFTLVFYPPTLPKIFMISSSVLVDFFGVC